MLVISVLTGRHAVVASIIAMPARHAEGSCGRTRIGTAPDPYNAAR